MHDDLVVGGSHLGRRRWKAMPHLARVHHRQSFGEEGSRSLDAVDRYQLVEMRLKNLAPQLNADREIGGELKAGAWALGVRRREGQPGLAQHALPLLHHLLLSHAQQRIGTAEEELPALSGLLATGLGHGQKVCFLAWIRTDS